MKRAAGWFTLLALLAALAGLFVFRETLFPPPIAAVLVYEFDAPSGQEADIREQLLEAVGRRVAGRGRVRSGESGRIEVNVYGNDPTAAETVAGWLERPGTLEFRILALPPFQRQGVIDKAIESFPETGCDALEWVPVANAADFPEGGPEVFNSDRTSMLVVVPAENMRVDGRFLSRASTMLDPSGQPALAFQLNSDGADRFRRLTRANRPGMDGRARQLAIIVDGKVLNAPRLMDEIGADGMITGRFTQQEVESMAAAFKSGPLPVTVRRVKR